MILRSLNLSFGSGILSFTNPSKEQFKSLYGLDSNQPVCILNLLKFREVAEYPGADPIQPDTTVSGRQAYAIYSEAARLPFERAGGKQLWIGQPLTMLVGPTDESWSLAFIAYYPSVQAFTDMVKSSEYQEAARHRTAALADGRLVVLAQLVAGSSFAPMRYL